MATPKGARTLHEFDEMLEYYKTFCESIELQINEGLAMGKLTEREAVKLINVRNRYIRKFKKQLERTKEDIRKAVEEVKRRSVQ